MTDFIVRDIRKNCSEMNNQLFRYNYLLDELNELIKRMSVEELFESSISSLVKIEKRAETDQHCMYRMAETLFRIEERYRRCEERIIDHVEDVRRYKAHRGIDRLYLAIPSKYNIDIMLY